MTASQQQRHEAAWLSGRFQIARKLLQSAELFRSVGSFMPALHDLLTAVREAANREPDTMVTLALRSDDAKWFQILPDKINIAYPFDKPPLEAFAASGILDSSNAAVNFWEPFIFADFDTSSMSIAEVENFLTSYLVAVFGSADPDEYAVSFEVALRGTIAAGTDDEFLRKIVQLKRYVVGKSSYNLDRAPKNLQIKACSVNT